MALRKKGPWSHYRRAQKALPELQAQVDALLRTRPRTRGKKAAKTRGLNKLARQISAAKGRLTKARNAIAKHARGKKSNPSAAKQKRSDAAKLGWTKRRARKAAPVAVEGVKTRFYEYEMPFLTWDRGVISVYPTSKDDRSKIGRYFGQVDKMQANLPYSFSEFQGDSIYDELSDQHLPFITDVDFILAHSDEFDFGLSFYRDRHEPKM